MAWLRPSPKHVRIPRSIKPEHLESLKTVGNIHIIACRIKFFGIIVFFKCLADEKKEK